MSSSASAPPPRRSDARRQLTVADIPTGEQVPVTATKLSVPKISDTRAIDLGAAFSKFLVAPSPEHVAQLHHSPAEPIARSWNAPCVDTQDDALADLLLRGLAKRAASGSAASSSPSFGSQQPQGGGARRGGGGGGGRRNLTRQQIVARAPEELFLTLQAFYKLSHEESLRVHDELAVNTGVNIAEFFLLEQGYSRSFCRMFPQFRRLPSVGLFLLRLLVTDGSVLQSALAPRALATIEEMRMSHALASNAVAAVVSAAPPPLPSASPAASSSSNSVAKPPVSLMDQRRKEALLERLRSHVESQEQQEQHQQHLLEAEQQLRGGGGISAAAAAARQRQQQQQQQQRAIDPAVLQARAKATVERAAFEERTEAQLSHDWDKALMGRSREQMGRWSGCIAAMLATVQRSLPDQDAQHPQSSASASSNNLLQSSLSSSGFFSAPAATATATALNSPSKPNNSSKPEPTSPQRLSATAAAAAALQQQQSECLHLVHTIDFPSGALAREAFEQTCGHLAAGSKVLLPPLLRFQQRDAQYPHLRRFQQAREADVTGVQSSGAGNRAASSSPSRAGGGGGGGSGSPGGPASRRRDSVSAAAVIATLLPDVGLPPLPKAEEGSALLELAALSATAGGGGARGSAAAKASAAAARSASAQRGGGAAASAAGGAAAAAAAAALSASAALMASANPNHTRQEDVKILTAQYDYSEGSSGVNETNNPSAAVADGDSAARHINIYIECSKQHAFALQPFLQDLRSAKAKARAATRGGADISAAYHLLQRFAGAANSAASTAASGGGGGGGQQQQQPQLRRKGSSMGSMRTNSSSMLGRMRSVDTAASIAALENAANGIAPLPRSASMLHGARTPKSSFRLSRSNSVVGSTPDNNNNNNNNTNSGGGVSALSPSKNAASADDSIPMLDDTKEDALDDDDTPPPPRNDLLGGRSRRDHGAEQEDAAPVDGEDEEGEHDESDDGDDDDASYLSGSSNDDNDDRDGGGAAAAAAEERRRQRREERREIKRARRAAQERQRRKSVKDPFAGMMEAASPLLLSSDGDRNPLLLSDDSDVSPSGSTRTKLPAAVRRRSSDATAAAAAPGTAASSRRSSDASGGSAGATLLSRRTSKTPLPPVTTAAAAPAAKSSGAANKPRPKSGPPSKQAPSSARGKKQPPQRSASVAERMRVTFTDDHVEGAPTAGAAAAASSSSNAQKNKNATSGTVAGAPSDNKKQKIIFLGDDADESNEMMSSGSSDKDESDSTSSSDDDNIENVVVDSAHILRGKHHDRGAADLNAQATLSPEELDAARKEDEAEAAAAVAPNAGASAANDGNGINISSNNNNNAKPVFLLRPFIVAEYLGYDVATNRINFRVAADSRPKRSVEHFADDVVESLANTEEHAEAMFSRLASRFLRAHCCPRHRALPLTHYCGRCDIFVCESCSAESHPGHEVLPRSAYCTAKIAALEPLRAKFLERLELLRSLRGQVDRSEQALLGSVEAALAECRSGLEARRAALKADAARRGAAMAAVVEAERELNRGDRERLHSALSIVQDQQRRGVLRFAPYVELHVPQPLRNALDLLLPTRVVQTVIQSLDWSLTAKHLTQIVYPAPDELAADEERMRRNQMITVSAEKKASLLLERKQKDAAKKQRDSASAAETTTTTTTATRQSGGQAALVLAGDLPGDDDRVIMAKHAAGVPLTAKERLVLDELTSQSNLIAQAAAAAKQLTQLLNRKRLDVFARVEATGLLGGGGGGATTTASGAGSGPGAVKDGSSSVAAAASAGNAAVLAANHAAAYCGAAEEKRKVPDDTTELVHHGARALARSRLERAKKAGEKLTAELMTNEKALSVAAATAAQSDADFLHDAETAAAAAAAAASSDADDDAVEMTAAHNEKAPSLGVD